MNRKFVDIEAKNNMDPLTYLQYLVSCMSSSYGGYTKGDTSSALKDATYRMTIFDESFSDSGSNGTYFKITKIQTDEQLKLFHVKDKDEEWNIVEEENQVVEEITINSEKTTEWEIVADVSAFSIYVIIKTPLLGDILVHYDAGEWKFTGNVQTFDVTYSLNNSNYVPNKTSQQPNKAWKMFAGWFLDQDLTNRWDWVSSDTTSSEFTVYAKYLDFVDATYTFGGISFTMMDRNLWATSNNISSEDSYWYYYQWWNNYGFENQWNVAASSTDLVVNNSSFPRWPSNYYSNGTFVSRSDSPFRWESVNTDNLWGWTVFVILCFCGIRIES